MPLRYTGDDPLRLAGVGRLVSGDVVRLGADQERVLLASYPDRFTVVRPRRRRAKAAAVAKAPANRAMRGPQDGG